MHKIDLAYAGVAVYPAGAGFGPYLTELHELVFVIDGSAVLDSDEARFTLEPGTVIHSAPGHRNEYRWDPDKPTRHGYVTFRTARAVDRAADGWPRRRQLAPDDVVLALLHHVLWLGAERPDGWQPMAEHAISYALHAFVTGASSTNAPGERDLPEPMQRAMNLVTARWRTEPTMAAPPLPELAAAAGVSVEHLCRVFTAKVGFGPAAVLRQLRLHRATMLLARSNLSVGEIALRCGFGSQFHFARAFRQRYGTTPSEFRATPTATDLPSTLRPLLAHL